MNGDTHLQEHQQLRELLDTYPHETRALPALKAEERPEWLSRLKQWWQDQMDAWWDWLRDVFGPIPTPKVSIDWVLVAQVVFWLLVGLLVAWLVYAIRRHYLSKRPGERQLPHRVANEATALQHALDAALEAGRWGLAARLRWRLFLARLDIQPHVTPREFFSVHVHHTQRSQTWDQAQGVPVHDQYRVMFSNDHGSRQWFDQYHGALAALEDEHGHG